jgi:hypothetical protein
MAESQSLAKLVPGFEFLQTLVRSAGAAVPGMGQWIAPTLDPAEIDKRIDELRTVQFWLEQNARMLATTVQALEVQRMTLSTLQTMNVQMGDLRDAMKIAPAAKDDSRSTGGAAQAAPAAAARPAGEQAAGAERAAARAPKARAAGKDVEAPPPAPPAVDPVQWWTALTRQFTEIATSAMKESSLGAASQAANPGSAKPAAAGSKAAAPTGSSNEAATPAPAGKAARPRGAHPRAGAAARRRTAGSGD